MSKKNKPKVLWATGVNLSGLYSDKPVKVTLMEDEWWSDEEMWWDEEGNFEVNKVGLDIKDYPMQIFASESKKEVKAFIYGAQAVIARLADFSGRA